MIDAFSLQQIHADLDMMFVHPGKEESMLVGNLVSIFVGGIITIVWSFIANQGITPGMYNSPFLFNCIILNDWSL